MIFWAAVSGVSAGEAKIAWAAADHLSDVSAIGFMIFKF
jgi:hypothetical protein